MALADYLGGAGAFNFHEARNRRLAGCEPSLAEFAISLRIGAEGKQPGSSAAGTTPTLHKMEAENLYSTDD